jgi:hypothetical protein
VAGRTRGGSVGQAALVVAREKEGLEEPALALLPRPVRHVSVRHLEQQPALRQHREGGHAALHLPPHRARHAEPRGARAPPPRRGTQRGLHRGHVSAEVVVVLQANERRAQHRLVPLRRPAAPATRRLTAFLPRVRLRPRPRISPSLRRAGTGPAGACGQHRDPVGFRALNHLAPAARPPRGAPCRRLERGRERQRRVDPRADARPGAALGCARRVARRRAVLREVPVQEGEWHLLCVPRRRLSASRATRATG